ncbi:hypothetical protein ACJ64_12600, partial [Bacillus safensis]
KERGWLIGAITSIHFSSHCIFISIFGVWKNVFTRGSSSIMGHFRHLYAWGNDWRQSSSQIKKERFISLFFYCYVSED